MIPIPPRTFRCADCGWSKTVERSSDVVTEGYNIFSSCPKCRSNNIISHKHLSFAAIIVDFLTQLKK